jgi:predicted ATPase
MISKILQVQIRDYKSIGRAVVDLEPFTVLVGANGTGKSNFVDALAFVQECLSHSLEQAAGLRGRAALLSRWEQDEARFGFRVRLSLPDEQLADYSFEIAETQDGFQVAHERCVILNQDRETAAFEIAAGQFLRGIPGIRPKMSPDRLALFAASATDEFRPVYDFLTSMRFYAIEPRQLTAVQKSGSGESLEQTGSNAASVLKRLEEDRPADYERVCRLLGKAVNGIEGITAVASESGRDHLLLFRQDLGIPEPGWFPGRQMSSGTLRLLGLLLAVYQPQRPSLIAIEEPEATVHPAVAELVLQVLMDAAQDRQVLITTHSPDILDAKELDDRQIRVVAMERGRTSIAPLARASREAIREHLFTPGELLRSNELGQDLQAAEDSARSLDLFGDVPAPSVR